MPRLGKIESLPMDLREQVHQRLLDGQPGSVILPWLNAQPAAVAVYDRSFEGVPASDENLSSFRNGPHQEWVARREKAAQIQSLSRYAATLASAAGGNMSAGAQAIATGKIMEVLEASAYGAEDLPDLIAALTSLRKTDLRQLQLDQRSRALDLEEARFQVQTCELFLKWYNNEEAKAVAAGKEERTVKVETLRQMMFGDNPYADR